jgi:uncharacterized protein (TIRG00374 family)
MVVYWFCDALALREVFSNVYIKFWQYFRLAMTGQFYNAITPFNSGGQPAQIMRLSMEKVPASRSVSALLRKFFVYQLCMIIFSSFSAMIFLYSSQYKISGIITFAMIGFIGQFIGLSTIILLHLFKNQTLTVALWLCKIANQFHITKNYEKLNEKITNQMIFMIENNFSICGFKIYVYSFFGILALNSVPFFIAKSFGLAGFPFLKMLAAQTFITLTSSSNPLPGAAGTTESFSIIILSEFFCNCAIAPAMILCRLINYYLSIIVGLIITYISNNKKIQIISNANLKTYKNDAICS